MSLNCKLENGGSSVVSVDVKSPSIAAARAGQVWFGKKAVYSARWIRTTKHFQIYELLREHGLRTGILVRVQIEWNAMNGDNVEDIGYFGQEVIR